MKTACPQCILVALGVQHAMCMRHIVICVLSGFTIFFPNYLIKGTIFEKIIQHKMCVFLFSAIVV